MRIVGGQIPSQSTDKWLDAYLNHGERIVCLLDDDRIVKFGCPSDILSGGQNVQEALAWRNICSTRFRDYFAPVLGVHPRGAWLIMPKAVRLWVEGEVPDSTPLWCARDGVRQACTIFEVGDFKSDNLGFLANGRLVCIDYGVTPKNLTSYNPLNRRICGTCVCCRLRTRLDAMSGGTYRAGSLMG